MDNYWAWLTIGIFVVACVAVGVLIRLAASEKKRRAAVETELENTVVQTEQTVSALHERVEHLEADLKSEQDFARAREALIHSIAQSSRAQTGKVNLYAFDKSSGECIWSDACDESVSDLITGDGEISLFDALEDIRAESVRVFLGERKFSVTCSENNNTVVYVLTDITDSSLLPRVVKNLERLTEQLQRSDILTEALNLDTFVRRHTWKADDEPRDDVWLLFLQTVPTVVSEEILGHYRDSYKRMCAEVLIDRMGRDHVTRYTGDSFCCIFAAENHIAAERIARETAAEIEEKRKQFWRVDHRLINPNVWELAHYDGSDLDRFIYCMDIRSNVHSQAGLSGVQIFNAADVARIMGYKTSIENAIKKKAIRFRYQPMAFSENAKVFGYEMIPYFPTLPFNTIEEMLRRARLFGLINRLEELLCQESLRLFDRAIDNLKMLPSTRILLPTFKGACMATPEENAFHERYYDLFPNFIIEMTEPLPEMMLIAEIKSRNIEKWGAWSATRFDEDLEHNGLKFGAYSPELVRISVKLITDPKHKNTMRELIERAHEDGFCVLADNITHHKEVDAAIEAGADYLQGDYVGRATDDPSEISDKCMRRIAQIRFGKRGRT